MRCPTCLETNCRKLAARRNKEQYYCCTTCGSHYNKTQSNAAEKSLIKPEPRKPRQSGVISGHWYRPEWAPLKRDLYALANLAMVTR